MTIRKAEEKDIPRITELLEPVSYTHLDVYKRQPFLLFTQNRNEEGVYGENQKK